MGSKSRNKLLKQSMSLMLSASILLSFIPFTVNTANAAIGDRYKKGELKYSNDLDTTNGLVQINFGTPLNGGFSTATIDGRTALKVYGNEAPDNAANIFVVDSNSTVAPKNAIAEFDMKIVPSPTYGAQKSGYVFGVNYTATNVEPSTYTWLANQDSSVMRIRSKPPGFAAADNTPSHNGKIKTATWQKWRIEYYNENYRVYVDDQLITDANFPGTRTTHAGLVGFMLWSQSENYIDNLKVYDLVIDNPPAPDDNAPADSYTLENDKIKVTLDKTFPQALNYQLKSTGGSLYGGYPNTDHVAYITDSVNPVGKSYPANVTSFTPGVQKVNYTLSMPDFHGGVNIAYEFSLEGNELVKKITSITGPGEPFLMSLKLDVPTIRARGDQANANIAYEYEDDPDQYNNYQGEVNGDTVSAVSALTNRTDWSSWAFTYTDKIVGSVYNNLFDTPLQVKVQTFNNVKHAGLYEREYYYRFAYKPNTSAGATLGAETSVLTGRMLESKTYIGGDTNTNSVVDWQDGALWVREQLPQPLQGMSDIYAAGGAWQQVHGTFPDNPTNSEVRSPYAIFAPQMRQIYYQTEGSPTEFAVAGWQQHGHDWRWGDWAQPVNPGAGGLQAMLKAKDDMSNYGGEVSYHLNQELTLDQANSYDPKVISRNGSGGLNGYSAVFGQHTFYNKSYFLDWVAGNTPARMNNFFTTQGMPAPKILYNDQMWDNTSPYNGVYGVHESWAVANIIKTYADYGINIATEGYQPAHLRNGQFSNKYRNNANSKIDDFLTAGHVSYHIGSTNQAQLFSGLIASRSGNLGQTFNMFANVVVDDFYTYTYLNAFLQQQPAMEYIDNAQMVAVRWGNDIIAKLDKTQGNKFMVTQGNVVIADGNDRFIPDLNEPAQKIHVYSLGGSNRDWVLPTSWAGVTKVDRYELTESGKSYIDRIDVAGGKVHLNTPAKVAYILVPAETQVIEEGPANTAKGSTAAASSELATDVAANAVDGNNATVWSANGGNDSWLEVTFNHETDVNRVEILEQGKKITGYKLQYLQGDAWVDIKAGTTIGDNKQLLFPNIRSNKIRLYITKSLNNPQIKEFSVFSDANLSMTATASADSGTTETVVIPDDKGVNVNYRVDVRGASANDGAIETYWKSTKTANAWLQMDFSRPSRVNRAVIQETGNAVTDYKIQNYKGTQWIDIASGTSIGESLEVNFPTVETQKMRLVIVSATALPKISEFKLFGVDQAVSVSVANANLAQNKTATQSSTYTQSGAPQVASRAVDGNTNGAWPANSVSSTNDELGAWWMVDLGNSYNVGNINIFNRTDCCGNRLSDYNVLLLDQNQNVVWTNHQTTQPNPSTTVNAGGASGRYVKIQLTGQNSLALAEVQVYAPMVADKSILQSLYADSILVTGHYTDATWDAFAAALATALQVLENADATEAQISGANSSLFYAREGLIEKPDTASPVTSATVTGTAGANDWYTSDVTVSLQASDDVSGVASTEYALTVVQSVYGTQSTSGFVPYTSSIVLGNGIYEVQFRSTDQAGNVEDVKSITFKSDNTAPTFTVLANENPLVDGDVFEDSQAVTFDLQSGDNLSGVVSQTVTVDGIPYEPGTALNWAGQLGDHVIQVTVTDQAGNSTQWTGNLTVTTSGNSMQLLLNAFAASGDVSGPLQVQLSNSLTQALNHFAKGHKDQAVKHLQNFLKHMENAALESNISNVAKQVLTTDANTVIKAW